jgi:hypothetical protein
VCGLYHISGISDVTNDAKGRRITRIRINAKRGTIIYKDENYKIIGACMYVHKKMGPGFLESVYSEALAIELELAEVPYVTEKKLPVVYEDVLLKKYFTADFVCYDIFWNSRQLNISHKPIIPKP